MDANLVLFYGLSLADGSTLATLKTSNIAETNLEVSDLAVSASYNTIFIILKYENGFVKFDYDVSTNVIGTAFKNSQYKSQGVIDFSSRIFISGEESSIKTFYVWESYQTGNNNWNDGLLLVESTYEFTLASGYTFSVDSIVFTNPINTVSVGGSISVAPNLNGGTSTTFAPSETIGQILTAQNFELGSGETAEYSLTSNP